MASREQSYKAGEAMGQSQVYKNSALFHQGHAYIYELETYNHMHLVS